VSSRSEGPIAGRSPRGRRNHAEIAKERGKRRSISAWAEEPCFRGDADQRPRVDLRVGGGTKLGAPKLSLDAGRSPRGRRNQRGGMNAQRGCGSISAWAEEPRAPPLWVP